MLTRLSFLLLLQDGNLKVQVKIPESLPCVIPLLTLQRENEDPIIQIQRVIDGLTSQVTLLKQRTEVLEAGRRTGMLPLLVIPVTLDRPHVLPVLNSAGTSEGFAV